MRNIAAKRLERSADLSAVGLEGFVDFLGAIRLIIDSSALEVLLSPMVTYCRISGADGLEISTSIWLEADVSPFDWMVTFSSTLLRFLLRRPLDGVMYALR